MTYKVYIKQDYKAKIAGGRRLHWGLATLALAGLGASFLTVHSAPKPAQPAMSAQDATITTPLTIAQPVFESITPAAHQSTPEESSDRHSLALASPSAIESQQVEFPDQPFVTEIDVLQEAPVPEAIPAVDWHVETVRKGDSLARIFKRLGLSPALLHQIMHTNEHAGVLKKILPGQTLHFDIDDQVLRQMEYQVDYDSKLVVDNRGKEMSVALEEVALEKRPKYSSATINTSLYLAGQQAGLSDKVIMQLVTIYGWDIDFALNIRKGDSFSVMYEEYYQDDVKVEDGPILAAEFTNQGKTYRAVRFTHDNGDSQYYADTGHSMRKAFLRTPVKFARISSGFNLRRKHPVLNRIRAHKGVDYAAPTGTPIKATGDGVISFRGTRGGYGRTVEIKHGGTYSTLYAHLSRYGKNIRNGGRVRQGQIIGYVGSSGLATGPHLHYEFRVHGVHRNPLTVKLPKAQRIPDDLMDEFITQTSPLLARLDVLKSQTEFASTGDAEHSELIAMNKENRPSVTTR